MKCYGWEAPSLQFAVESGTYKDAGFKDINLIINIFCIILYNIYIYSDVYMCKDSLIQVRMKFDCDFFGSTLHQKNGSLRVTRYMSKIIQCCNPWHPLPPPPFGLSVYKPYSDISDMLMPASQTTWSTRPCRWRWKKSWRV